MAKPPKKILRINLAALGAIGKDEFDRTVTAINQSINNVSQIANDALNKANTAINGVNAINTNLANNYLKNTASVNGKSFKANNNAITLNAKDLGTAPLRYTAARKIFTGTIVKGLYNGPNQISGTALPESILGRTIMLRHKDAQIRYNDTRQTFVTVIIPPTDGVVHVSGGDHTIDFSAGINKKVTGQSAYLLISNSGKTIHQLIFGDDYLDALTLRDVYILE